MLIRLASCLVIVWFVVASIPSSLADNPKPAPVVMKQHTLTDKGMGGMESHTILAPAEWKVEGGAWWPGQAYFNILPSQDIKVIAPDGRMVHVGPGVGAVDYRPSQMAMNQLGVQRPAEGGADNGYIIFYMPDNLEQWKTFLEEKAFKRTFPNATNVSVKSISVVPELTAMLKKQIEPIAQMQQQNNRQAAGMGLQMRSFVDCAVISATCFYELDGKSWEHLIVFGTTQLGTDAQVGRQLWWTIEPSVSYRAEAGQLEKNMPLMLSIANSVRMTPKWQQMKMDHAAKMNQISAKGAADRSRIIAESNRQISKTITDGWNERQASMDRSHRNFIKAIREVEDYKTSDGSSTVQLPSHYSHVYTNGNGDYLMTNDSIYNPNTDAAINKHRWESMEVAK